ncbi:MAG: helix-turn-helix transcriptional regulator [Candidatus Kaelpia aquatica]|nr:helix-turn-helix transcriptional regulator [Candidatus Kaelpia aquatica]
MDDDIKFWDRDINKQELKKILKDDLNPKYCHMAALLLARTNKPSLVFNSYIDKISFVRNWQKIKRRMRLDEWNNQRIIFWDEIYRAVLKTTDKSMIKTTPKRLKNTDIEIQRICNQIREYRKKKNITQAELAEKSGVSQQTISFLERGYLNISLRTFRKITDALELSVELLEKRLR